MHDGLDSIHASCLICLRSSQGSQFAFDTVGRLLIVVEAKHAFHVVLLFLLQRQFWRYAGLSAG